MLILLLTVIVASVVQLFIALFVFAKNNKSATNILFSLLSTFLILWAGMTFIFNQNPESSYGLTLVRMTMFTVVAQNTLFFLFGKTFPLTKISLTNRAKYFLWYSGFVGLVALSPLLFTSIEFTEQAANPVPGPGMPFFILHAIVAIAGGFRGLKSRQASGTKLLRKQVRFIRLASVVLWVLVPISNFVVTLVFKTVFFTNLSPIYTLVFSTLIAYTIVQQRLFDLRLVVARSVAYLLLLTTLGLIYGAMIFGFTSLFIKTSTFSWQLNLVYVFLAVILAFTFQPLKSFFDRVTNKLFFRDVYDTHEVLNDLTEILTQEIKLENIMQRTLPLIVNNLKTTYGRFMILDNNGRLFRDEDYKAGPDQLKLKELEDFQGQITLADDISSKDAKSVLEKYELGLVIRLKSSSTLVGYLLLGSKESGTVFSTQDVNLLQIASNELAIAIENARYFAQVQEFNITLQKRIKQATSELSKKNRKLQELDKAKDDFISMASHQLRTPLTTIKGYLSMLEEGDFGRLPKGQKDIIGRTFDSSEKMVYLISDLLNVSRINTGKFVIDSEEVDLLKVIKGEVDQLTRTAASKEVTLEMKLPKNFPRVMLDITKIRQVMMNFIDNAIYYTPTGGKIIIALSNKGDHFEFTVKDNGIGVPKKEQEKLFSKFFRASNAKQARPDGTGLGLFLARKVITAQGGSLIFKSEVGKGSTFGFRFSFVAVGGKLKEKKTSKKPVKKSIKKKAKTKGKS